MTGFIYHILDPETWNQARIQGFYRPASLAREGFIHCATRDQCPGVLARYYKGQTQLGALVIPVKDVEEKLVWENTLGGEELFPHIYGPLYPEEVQGTLSIGELTASP